MKMKYIFFLMLFSLNGKVQFNFQNDVYGTHQPVLYEIANMTTGPIIEFGSGNSSTDLLHEICKENKRLLITVDDDQEWLNKFQQKYLNDSEWHKFFFVPGKPTTENPDHWIKFLDNFELLKTVNFDLCFVDQAPWLARLETINRLKDKVKYIILHDCDYFSNNDIIGKTITFSEYNIPGVYDFSNVFKYFKVYYPLNPWPGHSGPPTLLASNIESYIPSIDYSKY